MPAYSSDETAPHASDLSTSPASDHLSPKTQEKSLKSALAGANGMTVDRSNLDDRVESPRTVNGVKNNVAGSVLPNGNLPVSIIAGRERSHSKAGSTYSTGSARSVRFSFQEERHLKARSQEFLPNGHINGVQRESPLKAKEMANSEYFTIEEDGPARNPTSGPLSAEAQQDMPSSNTSQIPTHRFSSPPAILSSTRHETSATSLPSLAQRHSLQPPKLTTNNNRPSREFSFSAGQSDEAIAGPARHSPVTAETRNRRASLGLIRRNTKPIHSEGNLDEYPPDEDALRWTEAIKAKRASRRRRKDDEDDDRVIVGTKVDQNHVNYVTAYNMLTGIRFTVSRTNAKMDRDLTDADFSARHKFSFDITGNELTPSAKYDFKFKDYAPWVFRHLRTIFKLDPADYLVSLTSKYILSELGSPGKSGSFFYFSRDYKYIIKTIHHAEHKLLRKVLREYYNHVVDNPHTLVSQFYGLHRVKIAFGRKIHFVVMNNLFPPHRDIHQMFDLKGSTIGRDFKEEDLAKNPRATLKDLNWLRRDMHLELGQGKRAAFIEQMKRDVSLLQRLHIMDYSLLVGIHDLEKGNEQGLREKNLKVFQPGGERADGEMKSMLTRTASRQENLRKVKELRQTLKNEKPVPMEMVQSKMPDKMVVDDRRDRIFYSDDGGFQATHENGEPAETIYYLGIIDCLTHVSIIAVFSSVTADLCSVWLCETPRALMERILTSQHPDLSCPAMGLWRTIHQFHDGYNHDRSRSTAKSYSNV